MDGYLFLIAHLQQLVPSERALNFYFIPPPHSGVVLCEKIYILLSEWDTEKKLFSMTLDNASAHVFIDMLKG